MNIIRPIILGSLVLILSGCTAAVIPPASGQMFRGYPCRENCQQFRDGYETAETRAFTADNQCEALSEPLRLGCRSYLHEYKVNHGQSGGYVFLGMKTTENLR